MITLNNYEQYLVLFVDGELDEATLEEFETFVAAHPSVAAELELFQMTQLEPDQTIEYQGKKKLIRTETTRRIWLPLATGRKYLVAAGIAATLFLGVVVSRMQKAPELQPLTHRPQGTSDSTARDIASKSDLPVLIDSAKTGNTTVSRISKAGAKKTVMPAIRKSLKSELQNKPQLGYVQVAKDQPDSANKDVAIRSTEIDRADQVVAKRTEDRGALPAITPERKNPIDSIVTADTALAALPQGNHVTKPQQERDNGMQDLMSGIREKILNASDAVAGKYNSIKKNISEREVKVSFVNKKFILSF